MRKSVVGWGLAVSVSVIFMAAGLTKFTAPAWELRFAAWGYPAWTRPVVGILEILSALLLVVPRTGQWATMTLMALMAAAAVTHLLHGEAPRVIVNLVLAAVLVILWRIRHQTGPAGTETV